MLSGSRKSRGAFALGASYPLHPTSGESCLSPGCPRERHSGHFPHLIRGENCFAGELHGYRTCDHTWLCPLPPLTWKVRGRQVGGQLLRTSAGWQVDILTCSHTGQGATMPPPSTAENGSVLIEFLAFSLSILKTHMEGS